MRVGLKIDLDKNIKLYYNDYKRDKERLQQMARPSKGRMAHTKPISFGISENLSVRLLKAIELSGAPSRSLFCREAVEEKIERVEEEFDPQLTLFQRKTEIDREERDRR